MYVSPALTDLGSFQELTLGAGVHSASGLIMGTAGSLVRHTLGDVNHIVDRALGELPGFTVDDNSHVGNDGVVIDPKITITPR